MSASAEDITRLRRMINELGTTPYSDTLLAEFIERYPVTDPDGNTPDESDWTATYDLHAAAADVWQEKAAKVAADYSFSADGNSLQRSQVYEQYMNQVRYHSARRKVRFVKHEQAPPLRTSLTNESWIINAAEDDD